MGVRSNSQLSHILHISSPPQYTLQWFRQKLYLHGGKYSDLNNFLHAEWEEGFFAWDANDLLTLLETWQLGDVSNIDLHSTLDSSLDAKTLRNGQSMSGGGGNLANVLGGITAKGLIMPCKTDLYFPVSVSFELYNMGMSLTQVTMIARG